MRSTKHTLYNNLIDFIKYKHNKINVNPIRNINIIS